MEAEANPELNNNMAIELKMSEAAGTENDAYAEESGAPKTNAAGQPQIHLFIGDLSRRTTEVRTS